MAKKTMLEMAKNPGRTWRVLAHDGDRTVEVKNQGTFDELVVDHWLHLEQMTEREWMLGLGHEPEIGVWIRVNEDATVSLRLRLHGASTVVIPQE